MDRHRRAAHRNQRQHAADGEINAPGDDDERQAAGENSVNRSLPERIPMRPDLEKCTLGIEDCSNNKNQ
jgi:hypothetical protein